MIEEAQLSQRNWMELRSGVTLSALKALATQMGGLRDGRKSILFFSQGPGVRPGSPNDQLMQEIDEAANRGNVTIHVIDPRPLGTRRLRRRHHPAPPRRRHRRPRHRQHQQSDGAARTA